MNINSVSSQKFGAFLMLPPQINAVPVPAIVRTVDNMKSAACTLPKFYLRSIPARQSGKTDTFILHEAILPDTKIRVVGLPKKSSNSDYTTAKLKGPGQKHVMNVWLHK